MSLYDICEGVALAGGEEILASKAAKNALKFGAVETGLGAAFSVDAIRRHKDEMEKPPEERSKRDLALINIEKVVAGTLLTNGAIKASTGGEFNIVSALNKVYEITQNSKETSVA